MDISLEYNWNNLNSQVSYWTPDGQNWLWKGVHTKNHYYFVKSNLVAFGDCAILNIFF